MMRMRIIVAAALSLFAAAGCGIPTAPDDVFDEYVEAYAVGDVEMLWELSSPSARADAERLRKQLLTGLEHPELALRVHFEGTFGVTAADIRSLSPQNFFYWAVAIVRRRLGVGFIRSTMRRVARIRIETSTPSTRSWCTGRLMRWRAWCWWQWNRIFGGSTKAHFRNRSGLLQHRPSQHRAESRVDRE